MKVMLYVLFSPFDKVIFPQVTLIDNKSLFQIM